MTTDDALRVLLVEDSQPEADLLQATLSQAGPPHFDVVWVTSLEQAVAELARTSFHVLLLDLTLPDSRGLDTVQRIQAIAGAVPVIVSTGLEDEDLAQRALRHGAQDYLVKGRHDGPSLARAIRYAIDRKTAELALRQARDELEKHVQARTAELMRTVDTLEGEVKRRIAVEGVLKQRTAQLRALASELTLVEQRERRRMAEVLHDHLQQLLVGMKFRMRAIQKAGEKEVRQAAADVDELITQCIEVSRSLTGELSPPILHEGGLVAALEWLARWMDGKHGLRVDLRANESLAAPSEEITVLLFQSVRELLFNVVKHAKVHDARVDVSATDGVMNITVQDSGAGFDPASVRAEGGAAGGFGLFSIRERLDLLGGRMEIASAPGKGSFFTLQAPLGAPAIAPEGTWQPPPASRATEPAKAPSAKAARAKAKIRVLLADDHATVRRGLAHLLSAEPDIEIVGEAADGQAAVRQARQLLPDVVIMDVSMPRLGGVEATRIIHSEIPQVHVIGLSMFQKAEKASAMLKAGAVQYLSKSGPSEDLVAAIRSAAGPR